jgi:hypothetical protein
MGSRRVLISHLFRGDTVQLAQTSRVLRRRLADSARLAARLGPFAHPLDLADVLGFEIDDRANGVSDALWLRFAADGRNERESGLSAFGALARGLLVRGVRDGRLDAWCEPDAWLLAGELALPMAARPVLSDDAHAARLQRNAPVWFLSAARAEPISGSLPLLPAVTPFRVA